MAKPCNGKRVLFVGPAAPPLCETFSSHDIELLTASDSEQALGVLSGQGVDALITDIEVSGIDWLSTVRGRFGDLIIIVTTGFTDGNLVTDTQLGSIATTVISQPYEPEDIAVAVRHALRREVMSSGAAALKMDSAPRRPRVLAAEDDKACRALLSVRLRKAGHDVTCVEDGHLALEAIESNDFDILLTDIQMPRMDGIELTRKVKKLKPRMPVIVMSANSEVDASLEALRAGAYCYVVKPVNFDELALFMDRAMLSIRLEKELREQNVLLEARTKELERTLTALREGSDLYAASRLSMTKFLSASVAHELKNPINSISASFFYVRSQISEEKRAAKPKIARHCDIIETQIERSKSIIDGMMDLARPDATHVTKEAQLNDLLKEAIGQALPAHDRIEVRFELDPGLPSIKADESKLKTVFGNLAINAAKAMKNEGLLTITTETDGDAGVRITFADTGPGLPASILHKVFDPFFSTDQQQGGTGLGLAICRETVNQCGGTIEAGNAPEGGAVFTITLPQMEREEVLAH